MEAPYFIAAPAALDGETAGPMTFVQACRSACTELGSSCEAAGRAACDQKFL